MKSGAATGLGAPHKVQAHVPNASDARNNAANAKYNGSGTGPANSLAPEATPLVVTSPSFSTATATEPESLRPPRLATSIPGPRASSSLDINRVSFPQRGSSLYPLYKRNGIIMTDRDSGFGVDNDHLDKVKTGRSFPLVTPTTSKGTQSDTAVALRLEPEPEPTPASPASPTQPQHHHGARGPVDDLASADLQRPPSIRVISVETEKESQKSMGAFSHQRKQNDFRPGPTTRGPATTASPHVNFSRKPLVLAGGIEDWEGVSGEDVDRYGFIVPKRPSSRPATSSDTKSVHFSPYKKRNVLVRRDLTVRSLTARSALNRRASAHSLDSHVSRLSTASHRSTRSTIRQAANLLPHNKDRRLVDEASTTLATQPGPNNTIDDELAEKLANDLKFKEVERSEKWRKMAKVVKQGADGQGMLFEFDPKHPKLVSRTWKGIPDCWRSAAWYSFLAASAKASDIPFRTDEELKADFRELIKQPSPDDIQIDMDVPRTINQHIMFRRRYKGGQRLLFRVLHALSLYFPQTGYVQGMAPLAATFLSYYEEESCFVMLVRVWQFRGLNQMYGTRDSELGELMNILGDFEKYWLGERDVAKQLEELCIHPTAYATRWYMTLFNLSIPFVAQLRVWDVFMLLGSSPSEPLSPALPPTKFAPGLAPPSQGLEILHATCAAIIDCQRETILDSDFENAMRSLTSWIPIKDVQRFMTIVNVEWRQYMNKQRRP
ncbi:hypothetical protein SLS62_005361 [Diatrype stigma]|uniref:Rab-GAP TBC domain-containing protein n=1 Tax=Diatrype stigma TaxID=117547 RepID=A0AAN9UT17_9PEZI